MLMLMFTMLVFICYWLIPIACLVGASYFLNKHSKSKDNSSLVVFIVFLIALFLFVGIETKKQLRTKKAVTENDLIPADIANKPPIRFPK
jgi:uncharacterized RDD family membrane protein YckC